jgi:hypothetical protein
MVLILIICMSRSRWKKTFAIVLISRQQQKRGFHQPLFFVVLTGGVRLARAGLTRSKLSNGRLLTHSPSRALWREFVNSPHQRLSAQSDRRRDVMIQKPTCGRFSTVVHLRSLIVDASSPIPTFPIFRASFFQQTSFLR